MAFPVPQGKGAVSAAPRSPAPASAAPATAEPVKPKKETAEIKKQTITP